MSTAIFFWKAVWSVSTRKKGVKCGTILDYISTSLSSDARVKSKLSGRLLKCLLKKLKSPSSLINSIVTCNCVIISAIASSFSRISHFCPKHASPPPSCSLTSSLATCVHPESTSVGPLLVNTIQNLPIILFKGWEVLK